MRYEIELGGRFTLDVNYWNGKTALFYEDMALPSEGKNVYLLGEEKCHIVGTLFSGVYLVRGEEKRLVAKLYWYDYIAAILPFVVGLIGKLIGAALGGICFFLCYKTMPYVKNRFLRLLVGVGMAGAVLCVVLLLASLFPSLFFLSGE